MATHTEAALEAAERALTSATEARSVVHDFWENHPTYIHWRIEQAAGDLRNAVRNLQGIVDELREELDVDTSSSASRQHFIDTGHYLPKEESVTSLSKDDVAEIRSRLDGLEDQRKQIQDGYTDAETTGNWAHADESGADFYAAWFHWLLDTVYRLLPEA